MGLYANLTMEMKLIGQGRPLTIVRTPFSPNTFATTSPPAALTINSPGQIEKIQLQPGLTTITPPNNYLNQFSGPYYWIFVPPTTSTNTKALLGAPTDQGLYLVPNLPIVLALRQGVVPTLIMYSANAELCDSLFI